MIRLPHGVTFNLNIYICIFQCQTKTISHQNREVVFLLSQGLLSRVVPFSGATDCGRSHLSLVSVASLVSKL